MLQTGCHICDTIIHVLHAAIFTSRTLGSGRAVLGPAQGCDVHQVLVASALNLDTYQPPIVISEVTKFIRQIRVLKNPLNAGTIIVADLLPSAPIPRLPLSALYLMKSPDDPVNLVGGRILDPEWIDRDLPALWKHSCAHLHGGLCAQFPVKVLASVRPTWLVDIQSRCLVRAPYECPYVALSYVWGNQKTLQATQSNQYQLQQPGSLSFTAWGISLSTTIRDAMGVVELLGERYLWVDTLCIIQDDKLQKHEEITKMGAIYANASVTIMAVQGEHANSGLRGFRGISEPRNLRQVVHPLKGGKQAVQSPVEGNYFELAYEHSVWANRGWTYQEHLLSRRKLIFDGDSLRWECAAAIWREHIDWQSSPSLSHDDVTSCQSMFDSPVPDFNGFEGILRNYNVREFTYPEDALNAFAGLSSAIGWSVGGDLVSGLPAASFDICLLWQPEKRVLRRVARVLAKNHCLPSWSWVGWSGSVKMDVGSASDFLRNCPRVKAWGSSSARSMRIVSWKYHETPESPGILIQPSILKCRQEFLDGSGECGLGWTKHPLSENPHAQYESSGPSNQFPCFFRHPMHPGFEFWYPIPFPRPADTVSIIQAPYISCRTRRAWLFPAEEIKSFYGQPSEFSVRNNMGTWVGLLQPQVNIDKFGEMTRESSEAVELVEVAKGSCRDTTSSMTGLQEIDHPDRARGGEWYDYYWVLWVEWTNGIAYRKGIGRVCRQTWEAQRREVIELMLG